jgi:toxin ParE1/3/4
MPNIAEYRLSPAAVRDLAEIWHYTNKQWDTEQANRYTLALKALCARIAEAPQHGQVCANIQPGYRRRGTDHHMIYFKQTSYGVAIIRILCRRDGRA